MCLYFCRSGGTEVQEIDIEVQQLVIQPKDKAYVDVAMYDGVSP